MAFCDPWALVTLSGPNHLDALAIASMLLNNGWMSAMTVLIAILIGVLCGVYVGLCGVYVETRRFYIK